MGELRIELVTIGRLKLDPRNPRVHSDRQIKQIARSIKAFGFNVPVLADQDGNLLAGHGRVYAARRLGLRDIPVIRLEHLTPEQARAAARKVLGSVAQGKDPARIRQRKNLTRCFRIVANESWFFSIQGAGGLQYCITAPNPLAQPFGARFR